MTRRAVAVLMLFALAASGCVGTAPFATDSADAGEEGDGGWTTYEPGTSLVLDATMVPEGEDWIMLEIQADESNVLALMKNWSFDFENPAVSPELTGACPVYSVGTLGFNASFGAHPFIVPERTYTGVVEVGPQPEVSAGTGQTTISERVRTTGTGVGAQDIRHQMIGLPQGSTYVAFGLSDLDAWMDAGATYELHVEEDFSFRYWVVHSGGANCLLDLADYDEGTYVRTDRATHAEDVHASFEADQGLVAVIGYNADLERSVYLASPSGDRVLEDHYAPEGIAPQTQPQAFVACGQQAGAWDLTYPVLEGTDHRWVYANTVLLEVPPSLQAAFPCGYASE